MITTYHPSRTAAREFAKTVNGKVIDLNKQMHAEFLESRWAVEYEGTTVTVDKSRSSGETGTHSIPASEVYGMMDRMLPEKSRGLTFDEAMIACGALVYPEKKLPANARILVSRNKREGKAFVKLPRVAKPNDWQDISQRVKPGKQFVRGWTAAGIKTYRAAAVRAGIL